MKKIIPYLLISSFICCAHLLKAQPYKTGIGLRLASDVNGLTIKHFIKEDAAIEGILSGPFPWRGLHITGLYEKHLPAFKSNQVLFFYGAGAHLGYYRSGRYESWKGRYYYYGSPVLSAGIDGIIGLEWLIPGIPFTLGADLKPTLEIFNPIFGYLDGGISFRYRF